MAESIHIERSSETIQTLYAELFEQMVYLEAERATEGVLSGAFVVKTVKGRDYWYYQRTAGGSRRQLYLGPKSGELDGWIEEILAARRLVKPDVEAIERLCAMLRAGGASTLTSPLERVLELLAEAGIFRLGGVLVGTHALAAYTHQLGVRVDGRALRTQDVDIAQDPAIAVALLADAEAVDIEGRLRASGLGFLPVPELDARRPSTSFKIRGRELRVDFLTPARGAPSTRPVYLPAFRVAAQPLRMLDYLIEDPVQAVLFGRRGVLIQVPSPARFVLHKLWLSRRRGVAFQSKAAKDVAQAEMLLDVLLEDRPADLRPAWAALAARGGALRGVREALGRIDPGRRERLEKVVGAV